MRGVPSIGDLRERVNLQRRGDAPATGGGTIETYTTIATVWARIEAVSGSLYFMGQQVERTVTHAVTVRRRHDGRLIEFVRWGPRRLRVERVRDLDPQRRFVEFLCEELLNVEDADADAEFWAMLAAGLIDDLGDLSDMTLIPVEAGELSDPDGLELIDLGEL